MRIAILSFTLIGLIMLLAIARAEGAEPTAPSPTFYQWTTGDGALSFTDNAKRIPAAYKSQAIERKFEDLSEKSLSASASVDLEATESRLAQLRKGNVPATIPVRDCEGHVTVTSDRIQIEEYNRRVFIARNECGETVSVTPFGPKVQINR